jgi:hypothetical protein
MFTQFVVLVKSPFGTTNSGKFSIASSQRVTLSGMTMSCNHEVARRHGLCAAKDDAFSVAGFPVQAFPRTGSQSVLLIFVTVFV